MSFLADVRLAVRLLRRTPTVTAVAVLSTALSVGAVAAVFTAVRAVLIEPLPYAQADRLVLMRADYRNVRESQGDWVFRREAEEILRRSRTLDSAGFFANAVFDLAGDGKTPPEALYGLRMTASLLPTLGVTPMLGRNFQKSEEADTLAEMILSYGLWQRRFHGDPAVVGRTVTVNGRGCRVIGVMGPEFNFPLRREAQHTPQPYVEFWAPMSLESISAVHGIQMVARLKPGVTAAEAQQDLGAIGDALAREFPDSNRNRMLRVSRVRDRWVGQTGDALWLLMGAAGMFLLIGCANVANLLLARGVGRQREIAIRMALGAGRRRIARQLLTEGCVLAVLGGAAGYGVAVAAWRMLPELAPPTIPRLAAARADWRVLAFALAAALVNGVLFAAAPAFRAARAGHPNGGQVARPLQVRGGSPGRDYLRSVLIAAEVAITVTLVLTGGRLLGSFLALLRTDTGFDRERVLAAVVLPQPNRYPDPAARALVYRRFLEAARRIPGVVSAGTVDALPFSGENNGGWVTTRTEDIANRTWRLVGEVDTVGGDYLQSMGARLEEGRWFHEEEADTALVSDLTARRLWPGESAVGKRICTFCTPEQPDQWKRVVGVVTDMRHLGLDGDAVGGVYLAANGMRRAQFLVIRTERPAGEYQEALRRAVASVDPQQPVLLSASMGTLVRDSLAARRFLMLLLAATGLLALAISAAGVYGATAYATSRRTQEIGIRMALGATPRDVHGLVFRQGFATVAAGLAAGLAATAAAEKVLRVWLPGLQGGGAANAWIACVLVVVTTALACWLPARRAMLVEPVEALRAE